MCHRVYNRAYESVSEGVSKWVCHRVSGDCD